MNPSSHQRSIHRGFTLIELVVVIVILGVLAAVAAPKFINLSTDAKNAALKGLEGSVKSAMQISKAKLTTLGLHEQTAVTSWTHPTTVGNWCETCMFNFGYPANMPATWFSLVENLGAIDDPQTDFVPAAGITGMATSVAFTFPDNVNDDGSNTIATQSCYVRYTPGDATTLPVVEMVPCQ